MELMIWMCIYIRYSRAIQLSSYRGQMKKGLIAGGLDIFHM
jgi:hypothetical protein